MGPLGWQETVFIFILALLIFGPKKLPELGRNIGKALTEFRRISGDLRSTFDREMENIERETKGIREETNKISHEITSSYHDSSHYNSEDYGYSYDGYSYPDSPELAEHSTPQIEGAHPEGAEGESSSIAVASAPETSHGGIQILPAEGTIAVNGHTAEPAAESADGTDSANPKPEKANG